MDNLTKEVVNQNFYRDLYLKEEIPSHQIQLVEFVMEDCKGDLELIRIKLINAGYKEDSKIINNVQRIIKKLKR